ncbi:hypothetical protein Bca4012_020022 [Brassica carinata]|uniref:Uncharacterized protein n=1 Tax=Brassica carinata TaxID=52824 RepID=A0A8X7WHN3_BRACI|nr:hypothetical protein Bca52824_001571 [Brassica carinata]
MEWLSRTLFAAVPNLSSKSPKYSFATINHRKITDPNYADMKQHKMDYDWLEAVTYAHYCIPEKYTCGGPITVEMDKRGRNYYLCKYFKIRFMANLISLTILVH